MATKTKGMKQEPDTFDEKKVEKIKKIYGKELTYSIYLQLKDLEIKDINICEMYGISRTVFWGWRKNHIDVLGGFETNRLKKKKVGLRDVAN